MINLIHIEVAAFTITVASSWLTSSSSWWFLPEED